MGKGRSRLSACGWRHGARTPLRAAPPRMEHTRCDGFTLLELLVALTVLSLVVAFLFGSFRLGTQAWKRAEQKADRIADVQLVQNFIRNQLERAEPGVGQIDVTGYRPGMSGGGQALRFVAPAPAAALSDGLYEHSLQFVREGRQLVAGWRALNAAAENTSPSITRRVLLDSVRFLRFSYLGPPDRNGKARWRDSWLEERRLPQLIRLEIGLVGAQKGYWPALLVAPKISGAD